MYPEDLCGKKILISPLNWGMGHVSRCIPLIKKLAKQNNQIFIACSNSQRIVFESYFEKDIVYILHEEYPFRFRGRGNFIFDVLMNSNELKKRYKSEFIEVKNIIQNYGINIVISDHRYGFRSKHCISIFMTHQLLLPLPWYFIGGQYWHKKQVSKFDFQWIVDNENNRLAGKLSNKSDYPNALYIGNLSRFCEVSSDKTNNIKGVLIISGPSAYYENLFQSFQKQLESDEIELIIGNDKAYNVFKNLNYSIAFHNSKNWRVTDKLILSAKKIFGYCGYSTLMDIKYLKCEFHLIACPGQLEQMYLQKKVLRNSQDFNN